MKKNHKTKHQPFSLFKKKNRRGSETWYVRFWDYKARSYNVARSLEIEVGGKKGRRDEAFAAANVLLPSIFVSSLPPPKEENVVTYLKKFWDYQGEYFSSQARKFSWNYSEANLNLIKLHIEPYEPFQSISINELAACHVKDFVSWMRERGVSPNRVNAALKTLRVPINYLIENDELAANPIKKHHVQKVTPEKKGFPKCDELAKLINNGSLEKHLQRRVAVLLGLLCGMRLGEVRGLQWEDIDFDKKEIHICHNYQNREGVKNPKWNSFRHVPLDTRVEQLLRALKEDKSSGFVLRSPRKPDKPLGISTFRNAIMKELELAGINRDQQLKRNISFHSLRHCFVTMLRASGCTQLEVMTLAGHKSTAMMDRYTNGDNLDYIPAAATAKLNNFIQTQMCADTPENGP